jgi:hypothetical protein
MNNLEKCLSDKENFIIITSSGSLSIDDICEKLTKDGYKFSIYETATEANPVIFYPIPPKEEAKPITPDNAVKKIEEDIKTGKEIIVVESTGRNDLTLENIKLNVLTTLKSGARSIVVMEDINKSNTSLIYSFKNEEEFVNILESISIGAKIDLSDKLEMMRAANTRQPSKVKPT